MPSIRERLEEFYRRLREAPGASNAEDALAMTCQMLELVEDELSGIPGKFPPPALFESDGRMYPPQADRINRSGDEIEASTRRHILRFGSDGSITIMNAASYVAEFQKAGRRS